mgnify:FL=1
MDDPLDGSVTGNTFVDGGVAGIDSVSYQGIAEPLPTKISSRRKICRRFRQHLCPLCDRRGFAGPGIPHPVRQRLPDGSAAAGSQPPGQYGSWEDVDLTGMTFDATIHAEYSDINTVRQSQEKRGERSLVLVEAASTPLTS